MGIRLHTNTWHRPLRTLDCWLPASESSSVAWRHRLLQLGKQCAQIFAHARRKQRHQATAADTQRVVGRAPEQVPATPAATPRLRVTRHLDRTGGGTGHARFVISGRMADVCAELDRLAAQEARHLPQSS